MAEKYLFFNSTMEDRRRYQASDIAEYWDSFLNSGLIHANGKPTLKVLADGYNMQVKVDKGKAVLLGHLYINEDELVKEINQTTAIEDRFDRVVLRLDLNQENRYIKIFIKEGSELSPPDLVREGNIYEVSLSQIHVKKGKSFIEQSDIIDERLDEDLCGLASSLVTVPSDIFTKEWKSFVSDYNRWFAEIQDSSYATVGDVRKSENDMKREISNLNLHLEANKRVKNGVTFGTNFADSFGIEIDMARTSSDDPLTVGQTVIEVKDASKFVTDTEITIFDDENLERIKINSIGGNNITLARGLNNRYKEGANLARSMIETSRSLRELSFGVFGTYDNLEYLKESMITGSEDNNSRLVSLLKNRKGFMFNTSKNNLYELEIGVDEPVLIDTDVYAFRELGKYTILMRAPDLNLVQIDIMDNDTVIDSVEITNDGNTSWGGLSIIEEDREIYAVVGANGSHCTIYRIILNNDGTIQLTDSIKTRTMARFGRARDFPVLKEAGFIYIVLSNGSSSGTTYSVGYHLLRISDDFIDFSHKGINFFGIENYGANGNYPNISEYTFLYKDMNGKIVLAVPSDSNSDASLNMIYGDTIQEIFDNEQEKIILDKVRFGGYASGVYISLDNTVYFVDNDQYLKKYVDGNVEIISEYPEMVSYARYHKAFLPDMDFEGVFPFFGIGHNRKFGIYGNGEVGYGAEITSNDIRFNTKPSKELVTWIQHDKGLEIAEAKFGNIDLDISTSDNETQAVGYTTEEQGEVRLTIKRASIDDNVKGYRILGGVN